MRPSGIFNTDYGKDQAAVWSRLQWVILLGSLTLLFIFPLFASFWALGVLNFIGIIVIVVLGLQIVSGYCGQISLGHGGIMAVGAFVSAILTFRAGLSFWWALPISGISAGLIGIIVGAPSLRIKGFYLALATLAAHYIIFWLSYHLPLTGGTAGTPAPAPTIGNFAFDTDFRMFYIIMPTMVLMTFFAKNLMRTQMGRAFVAIRDNDIAAEAMGINVWRYKILAFFIACFYAGIGGCLWAHWMTIVQYEQFLIWNSLWYVAMIIIGGMGSISGVFIGVALLKMLDELVMWAGPILAGALPFLGTMPAAALGYSAFGLILVLFLLFEPKGLAHRWELFKHSYRLYPFPY